eukprot:GHRR01032001.1.p1 GENE.GHRR01032001.1~~GHRR01032001.1.p1  ORF type:complete len:421 (+),score=194.98 GHRR01032001.1:227-1489(+)
MSAKGFDGVSYLQDVSSSEAYKVVNTLVEIGQISSDKGEDAKQLFEKLHSALLSAMADEKSLLEQAQQLAKNAETSQAAAHEAQHKAAAFEGISIEVLREDAEAALAEASLAQERAALLTLEKEELQRQQDQLAEHLDSVAEQHAAALAPVIQGLQGEVAALRTEVEQQRVSLAVTEQELASMNQRLEESQAGVAALQQEHKVESNKLVTVSAAPAKARRQADMAVADLASAQELLKAADSKLLEIEGAARAEYEKERTKQMEYAAALATLERARIKVEAKDRHADEVARDVELAGVEKEKILADQVDLDMRTQALLGKMRSQKEMMAIAQHEKLLALRAYKAEEEALAGAQDTIPPLRIARDLTTKDKAVADAKLLKMAAQIEELKKEVDIRVAAFLKEEAIGQDKVALFNLMREEVCD